MKLCSLRAILIVQYSMMGNAIPCQALHLTSNKRADQLLRATLEAIVGRVVKELDNWPVSILLLGGMSRGEATCLVADGQVLVFSDLDLLVVTQRHSLEDIAKVRRLSVALTKEHQHAFLSHIDIDVKPLRWLEHLPKSIFTFELLASATCVYGKNVLSDISRFAAREIPLASALQLLMNRCADLLLYLPSRSWERPAHLLEFRAYQISKPILDSCTALLAAEGLMAASYEGRMRTLVRLTRERALPEGLSPLGRLIGPLTEYKSKPNLGLICDALDRNEPFLAVESLWHEAGRIVTETYAYLSRREAPRGKAKEWLKAWPFAKRNRAVRSINAQLLRILGTIRTSYPDIPPEILETRREAILRWADLFWNPEHARATLADQTPYSAPHEEPAE